MRQPAHRAWPFKEQKHTANRHPPGWGHDHTTNKDSTEQEAKSMSAAEQVGTLISEPHTEASQNPISPTAGTPKIPLRNLIPRQDRASPGGTAQPYELVRPFLLESLWVTCNRKVPHGCISAQGYSHISIPRPSPTTVTPTEGCCSRL